MALAFEERLRRELRTSAAAVTVAEDLPGRVDRRVRRRRRHAAGVRVAAGIITVTALAAGLAVSRDQGGMTEVITPAVGTPAEGMWEPLPGAPITPRFQQAAVWTGEEMIVFGGYDGSEGAEVGAAAYSPATGAWRSLASPPGYVLGAPVAVWTGTEVVAFGGTSVDRKVHGAAYDPRTDEWHPLPSTDLGSLSSSITQVAWTGEQVLVAGAFGSTSRDDGAVPVAALYDPETDDWTRLPDAPEALPGNAVWTGQELVFVGATGGDGLHAPQWPHALALDPVAEKWRTLPGPPLAVRGQPLVAWTGREVVVGGGHAFAGGSGAFGDHTDAAAFDPIAGTWRLLPPAPVAFQGNDRYGDITIDGRVIAFDTTDPDGRVLVLDPTTGEWLFAPGPNRPRLTAPDELRGRREAPVVSTGTSALVWGGGVATDEGSGSWGCCRPVGEGDMFTPPARPGAATDG
jgi:hypothetical protein